MSFFLLYSPFHHIEQNFLTTIMLYISLLTYIGRPSILDENGNISSESFGGGAAATDKAKTSATGVSPIFRSFYK